MKLYSNNASFSNIILSCFALLTIFNTLRLAVFPKTEWSTSLIFAFFLTFLVISISSMKPTSRLFLNKIQEIYRFGAEIIIILIVITIYIFTSNLQILNFFSYSYEDSYQVIDSISKQINYKTFGSLNIEMQSPGTANLILVISTISRLIFGKMGLIDSTNIVYIIIVILPFLILLKTVKNINLRNDSSLKNTILINLLYFFIFTFLLIVLFEYIFLGHINALYSLVIIIYFFIEINKKERNFNSLVLPLSLIHLFWWPTLIVTIPIFLVYVLKEYRKLNHLNTVFFIFSIGSTIYQLTFSLRVAEWNFDLLSEKGGVSNYQNITYLFLLISLSTIFAVLYKNRDFQKLTPGVLTVVITFYLFKLFNLIILGEENSYGLLKLEFFVFNLLIFTIFITLKNVYDKPRLLYVALLIILFQLSQWNNKILVTYSFTNPVPQIYSLDTTDLDERYKESSVLCIDKTDLDNIRGNSYKCSRLISSLYGQDDRKIEGAMGWRFVMLGIIDPQDYFGGGEGSDKFSESTLFIKNNSTIRIVSEKKKIEEEFNKYF